MMTKETVVFLSTLLEQLIEQEDSVEVRTRMEQAFDELEELEDILNEG